MSIRFSDHALLQLKERRIARSVVLGILEHPDRIEPQAKNRFRALKHATFQGKLYLYVVIYDETLDERVVVTAFRTSKVDKYL